MARRRRARARASRASRPSSSAPSAACRSGSRMPSRSTTSASSCSPAPRIRRARSRTAPCSAAESGCSTSTAYVMADVCDATGKRTLLKLEGIERRARLEHGVRRRRRRRSAGGAGAARAASCGSGNSDGATASEGRARSGAAPAVGGSAAYCRARARGNGWVKTFRRAPGAVQLTVLAVVFVALFFAVNWTYQVVRKPSELFFPISGSVLQGSGRDVARLRRAVRAPLDAGHDAGPARGARAGRGLGQSRSCARIGGSA